MNTQRGIFLPNLFNIIKIIAYAGISTAAEIMKFRYGFPPRSEKIDVFAPL
jgi:hypothetical protein